VTLLEPIHQAAPKPEAHEGRRAALTGVRRGMGRAEDGSRHGRAGEHDVCHCVPSGPRGDDRARLTGTIWTVKKYSLRLSVTFCEGSRDSSTGRLYSSVPVCHSVPTKMAQDAPPEGKAQSTQARARGKDGRGAVYATLMEVEKLPVGERRAELLKRLEEIWESARGKSYVNKHGDEITSPDLAAMLRVVEVSDAMLVEADGKQQKRANLLELSMFKTERKTG
jgi:hypothetical protein